MRGMSRLHCCAGPRPRRTRRLHLLHRVGEARSPALDGGPANEKVFRWRSMSDNEFRKCGSTAGGETTALVKQGRERLEDRHRAHRHRRRPGRGRERRRRPRHQHRVDGTDARRRRERRPTWQPYGPGQEPPHQAVAFKAEGRRQRRGVASATPHAMQGDIYATQGRRQQQGVPGLVVPSRPPSTSTTVRPPRQAGGEVRSRQGGHASTLTRERRHVIHADALGQTTWVVDRRR